MSTDILSGYRKCFPWNTKAFLVPAGYSIRSSHHRSGMSLYIRNRHVASKSFSCHRLRCKLKGRLTGMFIETCVEVKCILETLTCASLNVTFKTLVCLKLLETSQVTFVMKLIVNESYLTKHVFKGKTIIPGCYSRVFMLSTQLKDGKSLFWHLFIALINSWMSKTWSSNHIY